MSLVIIRPTAQHAASNVVTATQQDGLTVQEPSPADGNLGILRLRNSGTPRAAVAVTVDLQSGGGPFGWTAGEQSYAAGAAVIWSRDSAPSTKYGYIDTPYLLRCFAPIAYNSTQARIGRMRELPDGKLGLLRHKSTFNNDHTFFRITDYSTSSNVNIVTQGNASDYRPDWVILPSGRLVMFFTAFELGGNTSSYYSDDNGATWALLSRNVCVSNSWCAEVIGDDIVMIGAPLAYSEPNVYLSRDGGSTATLIGALGYSVQNPRTCVSGNRVLIVTQSAVSNAIIAVSPGGLGTLVTAGATGSNWSSYQTIVERDDGVLWVFSAGSSAVSRLDLSMTASADGGLTWATYAELPMDCSDTPAAAPIVELAGCMWKGELVLGMYTNADTLSDNNLYLLGFGGWNNITDRNTDITTDGQPYEHTYIPIDTPVAFGWTEVPAGAGATVDNQGAFHVTTTGVNWSYWTAPVAIWNPVAGSDYRIRFRVKVTTGSHLTTGPELEANISDGANTTRVRMKFGTATTRITDVAGATIADVTVDQTGWVEWLLVVSHDTPATELESSVWYRPDATGIWVAAYQNDQQTEAAGVVNTLRMGSITGGAAEYHIQYLGIGDDANGMSAGVVDADLAGRPLSAAFDFQVLDGVNLGAYGTGGIPGDAYDLTTRYTYGASKVWEELRPSCRAQSVDDSAAWGLEFDRGPLDFFRGDTIAVFGTNVRTARWQLATSNIWAVVDVDVALDATLEAFTSTAAGLGSIRFANRNWRPGQWKSNGDSRRFFITYGAAPGVTYEITDNDEDRIYVTGVDLSAASGVTVYIFGDRMAARLPQFVEYRYARFYVSAAFTTADQVYRVGTPIFDRGWTPEQLYDFGFVERVEPNVATTDADSGASFSYRRGPVLDTLSIQWPPLDRLRVDVEERLRDLYRAINGSLTPIVLWRDTADLRTLSMVQVREVYQATNVRGELGTALTRVDQLVLREVW